MRRLTREDEDLVLRTIDQVKQREEERVEEAKDTIKQYEATIQKFKQDISKEVGLHRATIVSEVEKKIKEALEAEEEKGKREEEMVEEVRARIEREFADHFEARFIQLEEQLKEKEKIALEAKQLLNELQTQQQKDHKQKMQSLIEDKLGVSVKSTI